MRSMHRRLWSAALFFLVLPCSVAADTAFVEGEAVYRERIMPPPGAMLIAAMPLPNSASGGEPSLKLVRVTPVPANPGAPSASQPGSTRNADCAAPITQADMARCAHEDFLVASDAYSKQYAALSATLTAAQRDRLRKMQKAWLGYRTAACAFESGAAQGGSVQSQINWLCAARMTLERAGELARMASCREGDVACNRGVR